MDALRTAATGMMAAEFNVDTISNNLANVNTTGFRALRAESADILYTPKGQAGAQSSDNGTISPVGAYKGLGVKVVATYPILTQGSLQETEAALDIAIQGDGLFRVVLPSGDEAYTRAGVFQLSGDGEIVTNDGFTVSPSITVTDDITDLTVNASGEVVGTIDGQVAPVILGQFELVKFINEAGLKPLGNNLLAETEASGAPVDGVAGEEGFGELLQGFIETSNVSAVTELTNLISAQRAYEYNVRVLEKADEISQTLSQSI